MSAPAVPGFDYVKAEAVEREPRQWQALERQGFRRQVDGAKGETWYRDPSTDRLAFEVFAIIPAARKETP